MKLDRLLAIVMILVNKKRVQAKELADTFEISVRTVYRDIETINRAGIPIVTYQGMNGGIGIAEGYRLDRNVLTNDELTSLAIALKSIATGYEDRHAVALLEKIKGIVPDERYGKFAAETEQLLIDFSPWGGDSVQKAKIGVLKEAVHSSSVIRFTYYSTKGEQTRREAEPYTLVCKGQKWYLYASCLLRKEFRLFKLSRMKDVERLERRFERIRINTADIPWEKEWYTSPERIRLVLRYDKSIRSSVKEWFGIEQTHEVSETHAIVVTELPENDWLYGFVLSFGPKMEVLEPRHVREIIRTMASQIAAVYEQA